MSAEPQAVQGRLTVIRSRIAAACERAGRRVDEVALVGASKRQPIERMRAAWSAGLRVFGENRVQEAERKLGWLPGETEWHLIGPLQSNKARRAVGLFAVIHSLDRMSLASRLSHLAGEVGHPVRCFLQVNLGDETSKHGMSPAELLEEGSLIAALPGIEILGLMAIPPQEDTPEASRPWFRELRELRDALAALPALRSMPGYLSMGMSSDFEVAIEEGASHVRVGSALFGPREEAA